MNAALICHDPGPVVEGMSEIVDRLGIERLLGIASRMLVHRNPT